MLGANACFGYTVTMRAIIVIFLSCLACSAFAQDRPPQGIGFVQAEEGTWLCRHDEPQEALACAREQCAEQAPGQDCWATAWCFPANWSGIMTIWLPDFHTTHILCGAPSEKALQNALAGICLGDESATHCDLVLLIDPEGNERAGEPRSFPGGAAPPPAPQESTPEPDAPDPAAPASPASPPEDTVPDEPAAEAGP